MRWPFSRFRKQFPAPSRRTIEAIYGMIVAQAREPLFYQAYGVPDSVMAASIWFCCICGWSFGN